MHLKNKIIAVFLGVCIAGAGIIGINIQTAQAVETGTTQTTQTSLSIEQLEAIIKSLQQQIQQVIALIARLKPLETCGNGTCRFGETAATCAADCDKTANDGGKTQCSATGGVWKYSTCLIPSCIVSTKEDRLLLLKFPADCGGGGAVCEKGYECNCPTGKYWASREEGCIAHCGNSLCNNNYGETAANCAADCGAISEVNRGYKEFGGKCAITNVSATDASLDGYLGSANVNFTFTPSTTPDISGTFLTSSASINPYKGSTSASYLGLYCLEGPYEPTYAQTLRCGVKVGAIFNCALTVASGGSGTPINIRFIDNPDCAKEGEYQTNSGNVVKKCCAGLATYISLNTTESNIANSNLLCYNPAKNTPVCKNAGTANAGFYYPDNGIVRYERCVDRNACNQSLNADDCRAAGGNFFADQKCYCNY